MTSDKARRYAAGLRDGRPIDRDALAADLRALADGMDREALIRKSEAARKYAEKAK